MTWLLRATIVCLFCLCWPALSSAQDADPGAPALGDDAAPAFGEALPPPPPGSAPSVPSGYGGGPVLRCDPELAPEGHIFTHYKGVRRMAQVGAALLALITAAGFGTGAAAAACCGDASLITGYTTSLLIGTIGIGLGVAAAGRSMPPSGSYAWTMLGALIGGALTTAMIVGGAARDYDRLGLFITGNTLFPLLTPLGALWAYELSAGDGAQGRGEPAHVGLVVPTISVDAHGGTLGLAGSF